MSVELDPAGELGFQRPFTTEVSRTLRIHNPSSSPVAFKVKTTAPKQYCVRPNSGRIEPQSEIEVQVLLQSMREDPPLDARCRDKFLVQSIALDGDLDSSNIQQTWTLLEKTSKSSIHEKKIRVVFLPADGSASTNGAYHADDSILASSPTPAPRTPQQVLSEAAPSGPVSRPESRPADSKSLKAAKASVKNPATQQSTIGSAVSAVTNAVPTSTAELQAQLAEARATISKLQKQAQEQVLRQRKTDVSGQDAKDRVTSGLATAQHTASGVPVQVAAGLCLLCFLVAYLFF